ncbi:Uncharacterized protein APZ42_026886 [Daphnia magna]|uniref:Uncharacterized protein n=1 Tax=Daphnia magna TaxID=35525 RepID=A0A164S0G5_9CRUS|nr:Uncharacterized protein APZ42_026886 [Daphnia magna]
MNCWTLCGLHIGLNRNESELP